MIVLIITFVLGVFGRNILEWLVEKMVGIIEMRSELMSFVSFLVMIAVSVVAFSGVYTYIPNKKLAYTKQIPGAVFVAATWSIFTFGFSPNSVSGFLHFPLSFTHIPCPLTCLIFHREAVNYYNEILP